MYIVKYIIAGFQRSLCILQHIGCAVQNYFDRIFIGGNFAGLLRGTIGKISICADRQLR